VVALKSTKKSHTLRHANHYRAFDFFIDMSNAKRQHASVRSAAPENEGPAT
jgi:hypothetical protein